jgi:hypothetical protein
MYNVHGYEVNKYQLHIPVIMKCLQNKLIFINLKGSMAFRENLFHPFLESQYENI